MLKSNPDEAVSRIEAADAAAVLERLSGTDLMARGSVIVISVAAIRDRAGARWARKRDDVWDYLARKLDEHLAHHDIRHRIGETDFLIAMTSEEGVAVQAVGLKILEEVLVFFLGSAERSDLSIRAVTRIVGSELTCADLDLARIATARERQTADRYRAEVNPREERRRNPVSFVAADGQRIRVDFALEQIVSLRHDVTAAVRVEPTVSLVATGAVVPWRRLAQLGDEDVAQVDQATLEFAALFMPKDVRTQPPLILPVSFRTMGARKGRNALIGLEGVEIEQIRSGVMVELADVDRGTPAGRLAEVASLLGQLCRGVLARVQPGRRALVPLQDARLAGLTLDPSQYELDDQQLRVLLQAMGAQMRGHAPSLIVQGLTDQRHFPLAAAGGFTHAGLRTAPVSQPAGAGR